MKRKLIQSIAIATVISAISLPSQAFNLFGFGSKKNSVESMIEYIPASTPLFVGSVSTKKMVSSGDGLLDVVDMEIIGEELAYNMMSSIGDYSTSEFLQTLVKDYYSHAADGGLALYEAYGFDPKGASVVYFNGLYPVIRIAVSDEEAFLTILQEAADETGFELGEKIVQGSAITEIVLEEVDGVSLSLGFLVNDGVFTFSAFSSYDQDSLIAERFALTKPVQALDSKDWDKDGKAYGFNEVARGYVSFLNIAKTVFDPSSLAHSQLLEFMQMTSSPIDMFFEEQCHVEIETLVSNSPRIVFGTEKYKVSENQIDADFSYTLELKNDKVREQLSMLQGFLPAFITEDEELAAGLAIGLDIDKMVPALTELWTMFTTADYECEFLVEAQEELKSANPGILAIASGMAQGFKGVSIGLYDVTEDESSMLGSTFDAIAAISTEKPELLLSLVSSYVPFFQGLDIATDGTPTSLDSLGLPVEGINVAVQGEHIVIYSGEKSEKTALALKDTDLDASGIFSFSMDYQNLSELMLNTAGALGQFETYSGSSESCQDVYTSALLLSQFPLNVSGVESITENGFTSALSMNMDMTNLVKVSTELAGEYDLSYLDYDCSWVSIGGEDIYEDGEGLYYELDDTNSCAISEATYTWERLGNYMYQVGTGSKYRDSCDSDWDEDEPYDFDCQIMGATEQGFYCLEPYSGDPTLYFYSNK